MKIAHFGGYSTGVVSGVSHSVSLLIDAQLKQGHQIYVVSYGEKDKIVEAASGPVIIQFKRPKNPFHRNLKILNFLMDYEIDVGHLHSVFIPFNWVAAKLMKQSGVPYILSPRGGYNPHVFLRNRTKKAIYWYCFERFVCRNATIIHCQADPEASDVLAMAQNTQVAVAPNVAVCEHAGGRTNNLFKMVYMGRPDIQCKGLDRMMNLFNLVASKNDGIELHLYGTDSIRGRLLDHVDPKYRQRVFFNGNVFGEEKWKVIRDSSCAILCSRWDAFPRAILESMVCGVPVVISENCGSVAHIRDAQCGIVLKDYSLSEAEDVCELVTDTQRNIMMGNRGMAYALEYFSGEYVGNLMMSIYLDSVNR